MSNPEVTNQKPPPRDPEAMPPKPPVRFWRMVFYTLGVIAVALAAAFFARRQIEKSRAADELAALERRLDQEDPNWRLADLEEAREKVPDAENSALVAVTAARLLPGSWPTQGFDELFRDARAPALLREDQAAALEAELKRLAVALGQARRLADMPRGRHRLVWAEFPINTLLNEQQEVRKVSWLLSYEAMRQGQKGEIDAALRSCRACLNAARSLGDEPLMISQLIRIACVAVACNAAERALALGQASDGELARLQALLAREADHPTMRVAVRGERASSFEMVSKMASGKYPTSTASLAGGPGAPEPSLWERLLSPGISRREPVYNLRLMTRAVEITKLPEAEQIGAERLFEAEAAALGRDAILTKLLVPAVSKVGNACRRKAALVRALLALVAVERYRIDRGEWPARLEDLGPKFLTGVPVDPYDGGPLRYKKLPGGVTVYSVGHDGKDDGGNLDRSRPNEPGVDQGFRLWDTRVRRQPAPPKAKAGGGE